MLNRRHFIQALALCPLLLASCGDGSGTGEVAGAKNGKGNCPNCQPVLPPPPPPALATCTVAWDYSMPVDEFRVYERVDGESYLATPQWRTKHLSVTCMEMGIPMDGRAHYFVVTAVVGGVESARSNEGSKVMVT